MSEYIVKINVNLNLSQLMNVDRFQKRNQPILISTAADRYYKFLRNRFIALSSRGSKDGSRGWKILDPVTVKSKEYRGIADNPDWILREYDVLLNAMGTKTTGKKTFVGFVRNRKHPRGKMVFQLVRIHGRGENNLPIRQMVALPSRSVAKKMAQDVRDQYNRVIRKNRRSK